MQVTIRFHLCVYYLQSRNFSANVIFESHAKFNYKSCDFLSRTK